MQDALEKAADEYNKPEVREFARLASVQEFECYEQMPDGRKPVNPRIFELIDFANKCGYKKLGIAFCGGLKDEARTLAGILQNKGFDVVSVRCKGRRRGKGRVGINRKRRLWEPNI
jgi:uncharacterized metal-binding protein